MTVDEVMSSLQHLDQKALAEIRARALALMGTGVSDKQTSDEDEVNYWINDALRARGGRCVPVAAVRKAAHYATFRDAVVMLMHYVDTFLKPKKKLERKKAVMMLVRLAVRDLHARQESRRKAAPITHKTICDTLQRIDSIVESQFPGYCKSGLLPVVLRRTG